MSPDDARFRVSDTWEYMIVSLPTFEAGKAVPGDSASVTLLNREGANGWEAVGMTVLPDASVAVLLKRRTASGAEAS
jgi:hypothetical protein